MAKRRKAGKVREEVRQQLESLQGMYAQPGALTPGTSRLANSPRFAGWRPLATDADSEQEWDLADMRGFSSDLVRTAPVAAGAVQTRASHIVGTGLSLQSRIDAAELGITEEQATAWQSRTERRFKMWAESEYATVEGECNFYEAQDLVLRSHDVRGDAFVLLTQKSRNGWPFRLALQVIEADRVCNKDNRANTSTIVDGIERASDGEPLRIFLANRHPSRLIVDKTLAWTEIPFRTENRRNVLHLKHMQRPGQTRGYPMLAPIIATIKQLTRYSDAEVDAAVNSAAQAVFATMSPDAFDMIFEPDEKAEYIGRASSWDGNLDSGRVVNLLPGENVTTPTPGRPNPNYEPFFGAMLNLVSMGLGMPKEVLSKAFHASYSASRAALMDAWRTWQIERAWLTRRLCQPVYEEWLADSVALGIIEAPGFFSDPFVRRAWSGTNWSGDGPGALDPMKEAQAAGERVRIGLTSLAEETVAYNGGDWETTHKQRAREIHERIEAGLDAAPAPPTPSGTGPIRTPTMEPDDVPDPDEDGNDSEDALAANLTA